LCSERDRKRQLDGQEGDGEGSDRASPTVVCMILYGEG